MGQEISHSHFSRNDFEMFSEHLRAETDLLHQWVHQGRFDEGRYQAGFELEAWLLNHQFRPVAKNHEFLKRLSHPMAVPELAQFNFVLNGQYRDFAGDVFRLIYNELSQTWDLCHKAATELHIQVAAIGILPTASLEDFTLANMSQLQRYQALNEQVLRMREGRDLEFRIEGREAVQISHPDVMLEAATTSFQVHLRMPLHKSVRLYNASKILAGPITALCANSPFFLGRNLWAESRIPVFEQSVQVGQSDLTKRVSFGIRYAHENIMEIFDSNLARYPIMLPRVMDEPVESLAHLRLHNGTIWRWNRPLVGFNEDGSPHFRLEHRCIPAGPTIRDSIANMAFFFGLVTEIADREQPLEQLLPFEMVKNNFYQCARSGLDANIQWLGKKMLPVCALLQDTLVPMAKQGLKKLNVNDDEIFYWLGIIEGRLRARQNGTVWQRAWVNRHGHDMSTLMSAYLSRQQADIPVYEWDTAL